MFLFFGEKFLIKKHYHSNMYKKDSHYRNFFLILFVFFTSCKSSNLPPDVIYFSFSSFEKIQPRRLAGKIINVPVSGKPIEYKVVQDSIVLVNYWDSKDYYLIDVVNLNTCKNIRKVAKAGSDSLSFLSATIIFKDIGSNQVLIKDVTKSRYVKYDIDKLISNEPVKETFYQLPSFVKDIALYTHDSLLTYNSFYLRMNDKIVNKVSDNPILILNQDSLLSPVYVFKAEEKYSPQYFTSNVSDANILINDSTGVVWVVDQNGCRIDIYNKNLSKLKSLCVPEKINPKYDIFSRKNAIHFSDHKYYQSFYPSIYSNEYVYLFYLGINGEKIEKLKVERPVEILKMKWDGTPIQIFKIQDYLYSISLSKDQRYLYGTTAEKFGDPAKLIKYTIQ